MLSSQFQSNYQHLHNVDISDDLENVRTQPCQDGYIGLCYLLRDKKWNVPTITLRFVFLPCITVKISVIENNGLKLLIKVEILIYQLFVTEDECAQILFFGISFTLCIDLSGKISFHHIHLKTALYMFMTQIHIQNESTQ